MQSAFDTRTIALAVGVAGIALAGCDDRRTAEANTAVSEAEVSTDLPPEAVSNVQLEAAAEAAADVAATPPPAVIAVPVPSGQQGAATGTTAAGAARAGAPGTGTAGNTTGPGGTGAAGTNTTTNQ